MGKKVIHSITSGIVLLFLIIGLFGCEMPHSPDFGITQSLDIPLFQKKVDFLGGPDALVDTTKNNLNNFLSVDSTGLVKLSTRTDFTSSVSVSTSGSGLPKTVGSSTSGYSVVINLNYDDTTNGINILDLYDNAEAKIVKISNLKYFSKRMGNFSLNNAQMNLYYRTNITGGNKVYAGIVGNDPNGNSVFFMPKTGSKYTVTGSPVNGLDAHGQALPDNQLMTFGITADSTRTDTLFGSLKFNSNNSNIGDFISNLPTEVRFIGKAILVFSGIPTTPPNNFFFDTAIGLDIPLDIATPSQPATYVDTVSADLSSLPSGQGDTRLSSASIMMHYTNGLPLAANLQLTFLDQNMNPVTTVPDTAAGTAPIVLKAADVDPQTHFVSIPNKNVLQISFSRNQLDTLHTARYVRLYAKLNTTNNGSVRIQASDFLQMKLSGNFKIQSKVGGKTNGN